MILDEAVWKDFQTYLFVDRKISQNKTSVYAISSRFKKLLTWFRGKEFTRNNLNSFIAEMQASKATKSYMNKMIALCKHLDKHLGLNQLQDYTYFGESYQPKEVLTPEEIEVLAGTTVPYTKGCDYVNARQKCLILLLGTTGSRIGEVLNLKWTDFYSTPPHVLYRETKNGEARAVPIGESVYKLIDALPRLSEYVFCSYRGKPLNNSEVNLDFKVRARKVGIRKPVYNHIFRHSYITTMLEQGVDVSDVAKIVGHKNLNSTLRYKNSLLGYYSEIIRLHPLLINNIDIKDIYEIFETTINKFVDTQQFVITKSLHENKLIVKILTKNKKI